MKTNKFFHHFITLTGAVVLAMAAGTVAAKDKATSTAKADTEETSAQVLSYKVTLAEDGKTYQIVMKPSVTPKPDISLTGQVTLKAPHNSNFKVTNLTSAIDGTNWIEASRVDAPKEDAEHDYISFSFVGLQGASARNYAWKKGTEQVVFSFQNEGGCVEDVTLIANEDAFNVSPNSANTNPGNQFTNLGWGSVSENHYLGNYGDAITCKK